MTLGALIDALAALPQDLVLPEGFARPHSYRGYYDQLAFEPAVDVRVADMLRDARNAVGETYIGWKGGEFKMGMWTDVWLATEGDCGESITPATIRLWTLLAERAA